MADSKHLSKIRPRGWVSLSLLLSAKSLSIQIETACPSASPQKTFLAGFETTDTGGAGRTQFHQLYHG